MKKQILILYLSLLGVMPMNVWADKVSVAYIDMDYILKNLPQYETANEQLTMFSQRWQKEVDKLMQETQVLIANYQTEQIFLTEAMKKEREKEIIDKENEALEAKRKYFGVDGELFKKRESLLKPIQDEIYVAIEEIATESRIDIVKDRSADASLIYISSKLDISDKVLAKMGGKTVTPLGTLKKFVDIDIDNPLK